MTITSKNYTKHYYAGSERIATVIGGGGLDSMVHSTSVTPTQEELTVKAGFLNHYLHHQDPFLYDGVVDTVIPTEDIRGVYDPNLQYGCPSVILDTIAMKIYPDILLDNITYYGRFRDNEMSSVYFTHSDHLGSTSWITNCTGTPYQYLHYAPYGEMIANQTPYAYDERFKFIDKERDEESGYDYFGERYFYSTFSHWLSVDPMSDTYPNISPYAYCGWNPINKIDPDGRDVWELDGVGSVVNKITDKTQDAIRMNGKQISFESNSITGVSQNDYQTTFTFENEGVASKTFKFLADNSSVEYGLVNSSQKSTIVTQHDKEHVNTNGIINSAISNDETINYIIHNHPNNFGPSGFGKGSRGGDKYALRGTENKLGYSINAYVYQPRYNSIWPFSSSSRNDGGSTWNLPAIGNQTTANPSLLFKVKNFFGYKMKL